MVNDPEKLSDFSMDKSLDDAIDEVKSQITFRQEEDRQTERDGGDRCTVEKNFYYSHC